MNYSTNRFRPVSNTENGETSEDTIFEYKQTAYNSYLSSHVGGNQK